MTSNPLVRFLPLSVAILMPITFTISFTMARTAGHISGFNYISDTGTVPAESCYFGQLLNFIGLLMAYSSYYVYLMVDRTNRLEKSARWFGLVSGIGASLVANFQELNVLIVHGIGALMAFGGGVTYLWLRTFASDFQKKLRWPICVIATASLLTCILAGGIAMLEYTGKFEDIINWKKEAGGYDGHAVSVVAEWLTALFLTLYMTSLHFEMRALINAQVLP